MSIARKLRAFFRRGKLDADMSEEMRLHLEQRARENIAAGISPDEARYAALRKFGGVEQVKERCRDGRAGVWVEQFFQDLRFAWRQMLKAPGFTATVVLTLALGIGACTVVFTAVNSTLLLPLPGGSATGHVIIHETQLPVRPQMQLSPATYLDVKSQSKALEEVSVWASVNFIVETDVEPMQLRGAAISDMTWSPVPAFGRNFTAEELARGDQVIMLGHGLWQRAFGGSTAVLNRTIKLDGQPYAVVGIISPSFARYGSDLEYWIPLRLDGVRPDQRAGRFLQTGARLRPGFTLAQAQAELDVIAANIARQYPDTNKGMGLLVRDLRAYINRSLAPMLYLLLGAVACVLLIACANVANLLLARATVRQREVSIRSALGASRGRLVRQLLAESVMLAAIGGGLGIGLAQLGLRFIRVYGPSAGTDLARLAFIELDGRVVAFTVAFSLITGILFGLAPAWLSSRVELSDALKQGSRGSTDAGMRGAIRRMLVMMEIALALVLLAAAGLLLRSFARLAQIDPGFVTERVAVMQVVLNGRKYTRGEQRLQFVESVLERFRALPGIEAAAISNITPFNAPGLATFNITGRPASGAQPSAVPYLVTPDYFRAMGIRLLRGRTLEPRDGVAGPGVFVINETMAKQLFPNSDPLGQQIALSFGRNPGPAGEIVGIVADVMQAVPGEPSPPQFYFPWRLLNGGGFHIVVRTSGDPGAALPMLKAQIFASDRDQPVAFARPLQELMDDKLARSHLMLVLLGIYGVIALAIAAVGIYGVMAYSVNQRTTEFGVRMALGATRGDVLRQVLRQGMAIVAVGVVVGIGATLALGMLAQSLLQNVSPRDPVALGGITIVLVVVSLFACWLPARRATKVDPIIALRAE